VIGTRVVIVRRLPSQNLSQYRHWRTYTKERDTWFLLLRAQLPPVIQVAEPRRIAIHSYRTRMIDYANLVGGAKPIPDCLVRLGYLRDDSPAWFVCDYHQTRVAKHEERTEISFVPWSWEPDWSPDADDA